MWVWFPTPTLVCSQISTTQLQGTHAIFWPLQGPIHAQYITTPFILHTHKLKLKINTFKKMWAYVYICEKWLSKLCCKENSFQYKNICSWITGALMHKKVRPNNSFRNSKPFLKSHLVTSWPMRKKQQTSLSYRNASTANTIVRAILANIFTVCLEK